MMDTNEAIAIVRANYPPENYTELRGALDFLMEQANEIERLRTENATLRDQKIMAKVDLSGKQESLDMLGQSFRDLNESNVKQRATIDEQAKRIQGLEAALIETQAELDIRNVDNCPVPVEEDVIPEDGSCECQLILAKCPNAKWFRKNAKKQLHAEGLL